MLRDCGTFLISAQVFHFTWAPHRLRNPMILDQFYDLLSCSSDQVAQHHWRNSFHWVKWHLYNFMCWTYKQALCLGGQGVSAYFPILSGGFSKSPFPSLSLSPILSLHLSLLHGCVAYFIQQWRPPNVICISFLLYPNH